MMNWNLLLASALILSPIAGASAPLEVVKKTFSLTFAADGWMVSPLVPSDSMAVVMNMESGSVSSSIGQVQDVGVNAAVMVAAMTNLYTEGYVRTDSSVKQLGGKSFTTTGWKDTTADGDSSSRVRIYVHTQNNYLFLSWLVYTVPEGAGAMAEVEAALATLKINTSAGILHAVRNPGIDPQRTRFDIMGRSWAPVPGRVSPMSYFIRR